MFNKPLDQLTLEDILTLQENEVPEGKTVDYKLELNLKNKGDKKEFAKDITSFLNTIGGDLIIGVREEEGVIKDLPGIEIIDKDKFLLQIENSLRDIIKPRVIGLEMECYQVGEKDENKYILHIRVPQSYIGPHFVNDGFYARNNVGTYPLEYTEIKQKFNLTNQLHEQISNYHHQRIMKINADDGYFKLNDGAAILIHVIPLHTFTETFFALALKPVRFKLNTLFGNYEEKIHFEGIAGQYKSSYHHINRQGIIEIADKEYLGFHNDEYLMANQLIERIMKIIPNAIQNLEELKLNAPYVIQTSLLGVKGRRIVYKDNDFSPPSLRQDNLIFPPSTITNPLDISGYKQLLHELFMNAAGHWSNN